MPTPGPRQLAHARARHPGGASDARGDRISQCSPHPRTAHRPHAHAPWPQCVGKTVGPTVQYTSTPGTPWVCAGAQETTSQKGATEVAESRQVCQTGAATDGSGAGPAAATADPPDRPSLGGCSRGEGATQAAPWGPGTSCLAGPPGRLVTEAEAASVVDGRVGDPGPSHNSARSCHT